MRLGQREETLRVYGGSDYAVTADGGDYTVHIVVGIDPEGRMYLLDLLAEANSLRRMDRSVLRSRDGMEADGLGRGERARSARALVLHSTSANESDRLIAIAKLSRPEATRQSELNPFVAGWRSKDCTSRQVQLGIQRSGRSF